MEAAPPPRRRLRQKTTVASAAVLLVAAASAVLWPQPLLDREELEAEDPSKHKTVYLITFPALAFAGRAAGLRCPSTLTREEIARCVVAAIASPLYTHLGHAGRTSSTELLMYVVFREMHHLRDGDAGRLAHFHVALKSSASFRFGPVKKALEVNCKLASHWSCSHEGIWSAIRYGFFPTPKKPAEELDSKPLVWTKTGGHVSLFDLCQEPTTSAALKRKRENKVKDSSATGRAEPRATEIDLYPFIIEHKIQNSPDFQHADDLLVQKLKAVGSPAMVCVQDQRALVRFD